MEYALEVLTPNGRQVLLRHKSNTPYPALVRGDMIAVGRENLRIAACLHIISGDTATTKVKVTNQEDGPIDPFWPHASATEIEGEPTEPNGL